jgi:hypothetical protein
MKEVSYLKKKKDSQPSISADSTPLTPRAFVAPPKSEIDRSTPPTAGHSLQNISLTAQRKLTIGEPNDKYEQEADRVADFKPGSQLVAKILTVGTEVREAYTQLKKSQ